MPPRPIAMMSAKRVEHPIDIDDSDSESDDGDKAPAPKRIKEEPAPVASGSGLAVVLPRSPRSAVAGLRGVADEFRGRTEWQRRAVDRVWGELGELRGRMGEAHRQVDGLRVGAVELAAFAGSLVDKIDEVLAAMK